MERIFMMIGLPGSGKSTYAKEFNLPIVSLDDVRKDFYGDASIQGNGKTVFAEGLRRIDEILASGSDVVYDATNLKARDRKRFIDRYTDVRVYAVFVKTPLKECLKRNSARERVVPDDVIIRMSQRLEPPTEAENFARIIIIKT